MEHATTQCPTILVFRTSIQLDGDVQQIACLINSESRISKWNVDLHDVDKVLRIETYQLEAQEVIRLVIRAGYQCEELED